MAGLGLHVLSRLTGKVCHTIPTLVHTAISIHSQALLSDLMAPRLGDCRLETEVQAKPRWVTIMSLLPCSLQH